MNAKLCKRLRKSLNKAKIVKAEIVMIFTSPVKSGIPMTFKYPLGSYQRIYKDIKSRKGR